MMMPSITFSRRVTIVTSLPSEKLLIPILFQTMSRQQLRRTRLLELEREQRLEDAEGLFMTEVITLSYANSLRCWWLQEQRQSLLDSFTSVKFEFHDLDGLRWTQTALRRQEVISWCFLLSLNSYSRESSILNDKQYYRQIPRIGLVTRLQRTMLMPQFEYQHVIVETWPLALQGECDYISPSNTRVSSNG